MRYDSAHKRDTRRRILEAAGRVFRRQGYLGSGIDGLMAEAGLTAGAFYRHFESKEALLEEVLREAFTNQPPERTQGLEDLEGVEWVKGLVANYLSTPHFESVEEGCPLPALTPELGRTGEHPREAFAAGIDAFRNEVKAHLGALPAAERDRIAYGVIAAMVGGMAIARALPSRADAEAVLEGAREVAHCALMNGEPS